jgi:hypothetical protein
MKALITSAAYIDSELSAEFGLIPPSFLPIGARRLYILQAKELSDNEIFLSVPQSFHVPDKDADVFKELGIKPIHVPDDLTLAESLIYSLSTMNIGDDEVSILHGDTLITELSEVGLDTVSAHHSDIGYHWTAVNSLDFVDSAPNTSNNVVLSGFFKFSDASSFIRALVKEKNFTKALNLYREQKPLGVSSTGEWMDFGHLQTYHQSRMKITTERAFNSLKIENGIVTKISDDAFKMRAEANWFKALPPKMKIFTPVFIEDDSSSYSLSYETLAPLSDILVFGNIGQRSWEVIMRSCRQFLDQCKVPFDSDHDLEKIYLEKTLTRLSECSNELIDVNAQVKLNGETFLSPIKLANMTGSMIPKVTNDDLGIVHGDFCFSNILFDYRSQRIKVIDPRGFTQRGVLSIFGDRRYDLAKLYHSVVGRYDQIISGYYKLEIKDKNDFVFNLSKDNNYSLAENAFNVVFNDYNNSIICAITIHLFLSMIPLHADRPERQLAFLSNAYRLYKELMI